ncbi:MAG: glycosyltransferase [Bacteroidales bacterium]|nr:glycosyltransferase [Bacteroidales bacterium]
MHRSGTSTTSGMLYMLGLDLGKAVMGGNESNSRGFFENYRIMLFNEDLYRRLHVNWHNTLGLHSAWWESEEMQKETERLKMLILDDFTQGTHLLFKDPRICILLPVYLKAFKELEIEPFFILTYRNHQEVAESLKTRDTFPTEKSFRIWIDHMLMAEKHSREYSRIFIDYNNILADPISMLEKVISAFSLDFPLVTTVREKIIQFVEPDLNHSGRRSVGDVYANDHRFNTIFEMFRQFSSRQITVNEQDELDRFAEDFYSSYGPLKWPKFSIITSVKNESVALEETILSVVSQDYPNLEYVLIDRDPDKPTFEIIEKYKYLLSHRVNTQDQIQSDAIRKGLALASGEWVTIFNAGDKFINHGSLWKLVRMFPEHCQIAGRKSLLHD